MAWIIRVRLAYVGLSLYFRNSVAAPERYEFWFGCGVHIVSRQYNTLPKWLWHIILCGGSFVYIRKCMHRHRHTHTTTSKSTAIHNKAWYSLYATVLYGTVQFQQWLYSCLNVSWFGSVRFWATQCVHHSPHTFACILYTYIRTREKKSEPERKTRCELYGSVVRRECTKCLTCLCSQRENTFASQTKWLSYEIRRSVDIYIHDACICASMCTMYMIYTSFTQFWFCLLRLVIRFCDLERSIRWIFVLFSHLRLSFFFCCCCSIVFRSVSFVTDLFIFHSTLFFFLSHWYSIPLCHCRFVI